MSRRQLFAVSLKTGAEGYQVKLSGSRFKIKGSVFFMPCIIRYGAHCHRMVVEFKNINVPKGVGQIQRKVCQRLLSIGCGCSPCAGVP